MAASNKTQRVRLSIENLEAREVPAATPVLLKDINTSGDSNPSGFVRSGVLTFFSATDSGGDTELYSTDGTTANTNRVTNLNPAGSSSPTEISAVGAAVYFAATVSGDRELYFSNGSTTTLVGNLNTGGSSNPANLSADTTNGRLIYTADDGSNGVEIYRYDPAVPSNTRIDITAGAGSTTFAKVFTIAGKTYAIAKVNGAGNWQVYSIPTSGTTVTNLGNVPGGLGLGNFTIGGNSGTDMYFTADNGLNSYAMYRLNTTTNALTQIFADSVPAFEKSVTGASAMAWLNGFMYFSRRDPASVNPTGAEIWRTNGGAPTLFRDIEPGISDGLPDGFVTINNEMYFAVTNAGDRELWVTDGSTVNTLAVANIKAVGSSNPQRLNAISGQLIFTATNDSNTESLFTVDPINKTFTELTGFSNFGGAANGTPLGAAFGENLFMVMSSGSNGIEPHLFDPIPNPPVITGFSPDLGFASVPATLTDNVTQPGNFTFTGRANGAQQIRLYRNSVALGSGTFTANADGTWTSPAYSLGNLNQTTVHNITARATDASTQTSVDGATFTITTDGQNPSVPVFVSMADDNGSSNTDRITNDTTPTLSGTAEANAFINIYTYRNGVQQADELLVPVDSSGNWSYTPAVALTDATYQFYGDVQDRVANRSTQTVSPFTVVIDSTPAPTPALSNSLSTDSGQNTSDRITNDTTPTISGTAEANATIKIYRDNVLFDTTTAAANGSWSKTLPAMTDGVYQFYITATDLAGNAESSASLTRTFTIDTTPSLVPVLDNGILNDTGANASDKITSDTTLTLTGSQAADTNRVLVYNGLTFLNYATLNGLTWSFNTATLPEGTYNFNVVSEDVAGNLSAPSASMAVTVDTTAPVIPVYTNFTVNSGSTADNITNDNTLTINGTAEAGTTVTLKNGTTVLGTGVATGGNWSITTAALADGNYTLTASTEDLAGNVSPVLTLPTITVDATAPTAPAITLFTPITPVNALTFGSTTAATVIKLDGVSAEPNAVIEVYDGLNLLGQTTTDASGVWSYTTGTLSDGLYNFNAKVIDVAANVSPASATLSITVDTSLQANVTISEDSGSRNFKGSDLLAIHNSSDTLGALRGVAITSLVGTGTWSFSTNGRTFIAINPATISTTRSLLLRETDTLRFTPATNFVGIATLEFRAWDQTGGKFGDVANTTVNGAGTPFSASVEIVRLGVVNSNDRPVLNTTFAPTLPPVIFADPNDLGVEVSSLIQNRFTDSDPTSQPGIAVVGVGAGGNWEYQLPGSTTWTPIIKPSLTKATLLNQFSRIRFQPTTMTYGTATLQYRAWDGNTGVNGAINFSTTAALNATSFGSVTETATASVGNSQPQLATSNPNMPIINENTTNPPGIVVSKLFAANFIDGDPKTAAGMAITSVDESFGLWQYSTGGTTWRSLTGVSSTNVVLLKGTHKIRFVPNPNQFGSTTLTFRGWDGSAGTAGEWMNPTGQSAFSVEVDTVTQVVNSVNTRPTLVTTGTPLLASLPLNSTTSTVAGTSVSSLINGTVSDADNSTGSIGIAVTAIKGTGTWQYNRLSGSAGDSNWLAIAPVSATSAILLTPGSFVRFVPTTTTGPAQIASLTFKAWDSTFGTATGPTKFSTTTNTAFSTNTETAYVSVGNAVPTQSPTAPTFVPLLEDPRTNAGTTLKALLGTAITPAAPTITGKGVGIAITAIDNTNGVWQYALTSKFVNIPNSVSDTNALLLPDTAKLKFVPNVNYFGTSNNTITYKAWDRTVGIAGEFADTTRVDVNAFSTTTAVTSSMNVTPVNDRPVVSVGTSVLLTPIALNDSNPTGDTVSTLISGAMTDVDSVNVGIAVTGLTGLGAWQYSSNGGTSWVTIDKPTVAKAWLLDPTWLVRFVPTTPSVIGQASITFRAWDGSANSAHTVGGPLVNAGSASDSSFSTAAITAYVSVGNSAPTI